MPELKERKRRAPARSTDVVLGALQERLNVAVDADSPHAIRIEELFDELKRSLRKNGDDSDE